MPMPTIRELLRAEEKNIPRFEIESLLAHALKKTRVFVLAHPEYRVTKKIKKRFDQLLERRKNHEPVALIIGQREFYGREFFVNASTLVPRPETEILVEKIVSRFDAQKKLRDKKNISKEKFSTLILDIGTGSGNIITTLVKELEKKNIPEKNFSFIASDISREALQIAKKNAKTHGAEKNIRFIRSDILANIPEKLFQDTQEIIIAANLPYLSKKEYEDAPPDVRNFEPKSALESGKDGLGHCRKLLEELRNLTLEKKILSRSLVIFFEISPSQKNSLQKLVSNIFPKADISFFRDLARKWRVAKIKI